MWGSRTVFGRSAETFKALLEYASPSNEYSLPANETATQLVRLPVANATVEFEFTSDEAGVGQRFATVLESALARGCEERLVLRVLCDANAPATIWATSTGSGGAGEPRVRVQLNVARSYPVLRCVQLSRCGSTGAVPDAVVEQLLSRCDLTTVWKLKCEY